MTGRTITTKTLAALLTAAAALFAAHIALDTLRAVVPLWSPLPWFDEWSTPKMLRWWRDGDVSAAEALLTPFNEHRIAVPRLVFFADDWLFRGRNMLPLAGIFVVQGLHAGLFATVLARARPRSAGRWAVAAVVVALMFSLRQQENLSSAFQLQFVGVFAGATLACVLFAAAIGRMRAGKGALVPLSASFAAALLDAFTMANGLAVPWTLAALALLGRARTRVVLGCLAWAAAITAVYLWGYEPGAHHGGLAESLRRPGAFLLYASVYLGNIISDGTTELPAVFGAAGIALAACAAWRAAVYGAKPPALAMLGVMAFACAAAAITAAGRLDFGTSQAMSGRYVAGSVALWSAHLVYWWVDPPRLPGCVGLPPSGAALARAAVLGVAAALCWAMAGEQGRGKPQLAAQSFAQNESADLLMLGLDDPAIVRRAAWSDEDVQSLLPMLREGGLSIFGTADYAGIGRPVTARGNLGPPCEGEVAGAVADPALGPGGVRVSGRALDGRRLVRRVLLADAEGRVVGLASGAVPGAGRGAWRGFAVAPVGAVLTAYGSVDGGQLCRVGDGTVASAVGPR